MLLNQTHRFTPPNSEAVITISGLQSYSPGQSKKVDVYRFEVPADLQEVIPDGYECDNWAQVLRTLARIFCGDNEAVAKSLIT